MRLPGSSTKSFKLEHSYDDHKYNSDHPYKNGDDLSISTITGGSERPSYSDDPLTKVFETAEEKRLRKRSHWVAYATTFVMTIGFSVVVTGVWPYLQTLYPDEELSKTWLGYVIAANPMGQLIASPFVGYLGSRFGSIRKICYCTMTLFIIGNIFYSFVNVTTEWFHLSACYMMVLSRFIVGLSSSNVTLCRSYIAASTTVKERTTAITLVSAAQATGYVVGPAIQTVVSLAVENEQLQYRACGWIAALLGVVNFIILTPWIFTEYNMAEKERALLNSQRSPSEENVLPKPDYPGVFAVLFAFFMNQFVYVLIETLFEAFVSDQYAFCDELAVIIVGVSLAIGGIWTIFMFLTATRLAKKYDERKILMFAAFIPIAIGTLLFQPLGSETLTYCGGDPWSTMTQASTLITTEPTSSPIAPLLLDIKNPIIAVDSVKTRQLLDISDPYNHNKEAGNFCENEGNCYGCPKEQDWCDGYTQLNMVQFYVAFFFVISGYPYGVSMSNSIMSKMLGPNPQGLWMGILTASGSFARVLGPIFVSQVYTKVGTRWTFGLLFVGMLIAIAELTIMFKRVVPMKIPSFKDAGRV